MRGHEKARALRSADAGLKASIAELTSMALLAPPCCSRIALCDGACGDARPADGGWCDTRIGSDTR